MSSLLVHAWTLHKKENNYFIPYTHWVYLNEIVKYYDEIWLLSPVKYDDNLNSGFVKLDMFQNIKVFELPYSRSYISTVKYFRSYYKGYKILSKTCDKVYTRYPGPYGWLQKFFFKDEARIIHYVGDPLDTIVNNPKLSDFKKKLYSLFFKPEDLMFDLACKGAKVYTNGHHISNKLKKKKIDAIPLISSTLNEEDFFFESKILNAKCPKFIYVGYLRKAKGVETILKAFAIVQKIIPEASLTIVGSGESEEDLHNIVRYNCIKNVVFTGHIDKREELNNLLRNHDVFVFGSLSEGSPRVILEAMANGLAIVSTPVGSLPSTFKDKEEVLFANFNDEIDFSIKMKAICEQNVFNKIRINSFNKVKNFTIDKFLKIIFDNA